MAVENINFLRQKRQRLERQRRFDPLVLAISVGFFVLVGVITAGVFAWRLRLQNQIATLKRSQQQQEQLLRGEAQREAEYLVFAARLTALSSLFSERVSQRRPLEFLDSLAIPGVSYEQPEFERSAAELSFRATMASIFTLEKFLAVFDTPAIREQILRADVHAITRTDAGAYAVEMSIRLRPEKAESQVAPPPAGARP